MRQPRLSSVIERRLLVNYRADPRAVAGICLIRLGQVRPHGAPGRFGLRSENAAHRIAVGELDTDSWRVQPVEVHVVRSTFFDDEDRFPPGSVTLGCALLMRDVPVTWNPLRPMPIPGASGTAGARPAVGPGTRRSTG
jgi:hypothetical protein